MDACDTSNSTYRVTFDRAGLGTHSIPDFEVLSTTEPDTVPLTTFTSRPRPRPVAVKEERHQPLMMPYGHGAAAGAGMSPVKYGLYSPGLSNDPMVGGSTPRGKVRCQCQFNLVFLGRETMRVILEEFINYKPALFLSRRLCAWTARSEATPSDSWSRLSG